MKVLASLLLVCATAGAVIVENTNVAKDTFYYAVEGGKVTVRRCSEAPSSNIDPAKCESVKHYDPIALPEFRDLIFAWGTYEAEMVANSASSDDGLLARKRVQLEEVRRILKELPAGAASRKDYQDRESDLVKEIARLEGAVADAKAQLVGFDSLFGNHGYLESDLVHPVVRDQNTYVEIRPLVKHFLDVFRYQNGFASDPIGPARAVKADLLSFQAKQMHPYCAYWNGGMSGYYDNLDQLEGQVRVWVALPNQKADYAGAKSLCEAQQMKLPQAEHIPFYHSHLWYGGSEEESWTQKKSIGMFIATDLFKSLPDFQFGGREKIKMFWGATTWYPRAADYDAIQLADDGSWYSYQGMDESMRGAAPAVDTAWQLSVVCEKEYEIMPRYVREGEFPGCVAFHGQP